MDAQFYKEKTQHATLYLADIFQKGKYGQLPNLLKKHPAPSFGLGHQSSNLARLTLHHDKKLMKSTVAISFCLMLHVILYVYLKPMYNILLSHSHIVNSNRNNTQLVSMSHSLGFEVTDKTFISSIAFYSS